MVLYKFNSNTQKTEIVKGGIEKLYPLFWEEVEKIKEGLSDFTYIDISIEETGYVGMKWNN